VFGSVPEGAADQVGSMAHAVLVRRLVKGAHVPLL
jgi:hypothetical protein